MMMSGRPVLLWEGSLNFPYLGNRTTMCAYEGGPQLCCHREEEEWEILLIQSISVFESSCFKPEYCCKAYS